MALRFEMDDMGKKTYDEIGEEFRNIEFVTWNHLRDEKNKHNISGVVSSQEEARKVFSILEFYLPEENGH